MSSSYSMKITSKMKINILHWQYLRITASSSTTLHSKNWSQRRLTKRYNSPLANLIKSQRQSNRHCSLTNTRLRGSNSRNKNKVTLINLLFINEVNRYFCHMPSKADKIGRAHV